MLHVVHFSTVSQGSVSSPVAPWAPMLFPYQIMPDYGAEVQQLPELPMKMSFVMRFSLFSFTVAACTGVCFPLGQFAGFLM